MESTSIAPFVKSGKCGREQGVSPQPLDHVRSTYEIHFYSLVARVFKLTKRKQEKTRRTVYSVM